MANKKTRLKATMKGDVTSVTCLIKHPMETGNRKGDDGNLIPINYIKYLRFIHNGELVSTADLGPGISSDPLITVEILGAKIGDKVSVEWVDNLGESDTAEALVK